MATYDLDLNRIMRSIRQKKATGGYVPQTFINDILEANINQAAGRAGQEKALSLQEQAQKTSAENEAKRIALSEASAATQKEQYATSSATQKEQYEKSLAEAARNSDLNRGLTEQQINSQGKSNIASLVTALPATYLAAKSLFGKTDAEKATDLAKQVADEAAKKAAEEALKQAAPVVNPATTPQPVTPQVDTAAPRWLQNENTQPLDRMLTDQTPNAEAFDAGTPSPGVGDIPVQGTPATVDYAPNMDYGTMEGAYGPTTTGGGPTLGGAAGVLGYIKAASAMRNSKGELEKEYEDRGPLAKLTSAPVMGGPPAILDALGVGDSNYFSKQMSELAKGEERLVGQPLDLAWSALDKTLSGDISGASKDLGQSFADFGKGVVRAPEAIWKSITGGGKK